MWLATGCSSVRCHHKGYGCEPFEPWVGGLADARLYKKIVGCCLTDGDG